MALADRADEAAAGRDRQLRIGVLGHQVRGLRDRVVALDGGEPRLLAIRDQVFRGEPLLVEEALLAHPVGVVHLAQVPRAVVVEDDDDGLAGLEAIGELQQPAIAEPAELPAKMPSSRAIRLVMIAASRSVTFSKWSMTEKSTFFGRKSSPMPSVMYG